MECAVRLGKTQAEFERGYYVMDIFDVLDAQKRIRAEHLLENLNTAVMSRTTDVDEFRKYTASLQKRAGYDASADKPTFDEAGFERMRWRLKNGI